MCMSHCTTVALPFVRATASQPVSTTQSLLQHGGKPETASSGDDEDADEGSAEGVDASPGASEVSGPAGGEDAAPHEPTPRSAAAVAAEAATETAPAAAAGKAKFLEFNEKWLEETEGMAADFVNTPAMEHLKDGSFGVCFTLDPKPLWHVLHLKCNGRMPVIG